MRLSKSSSPNVKGNKAKLQFGMVVHRDPLNVGGNSIARAVFPMRPKSSLLPTFLNRIMHCFAPVLRILKKCFRRMPEKR